MGKKKKNINLRILRIFKKFKKMIKNRNIIELLKTPISLQIPKNVKSYLIENAHKKGSGSTKNGRDSISKRRGVKLLGNRSVSTGGIIVRQVGCKFHPGKNVGVGKDYTLYAGTSGIVKFERYLGRDCVSVHPFMKTKNIDAKISRCVEYIVTNQDCRLIHCDS